MTRYCGSGIRCLFDPGIRDGFRDPGWVPGSGMGSGMNNPYHISESLETNFLGLKYLNSWMRIRDGKIRIRDRIRNTDMTCLGYSINK
jgi:hypothetical protein